MEVDTMSTPNSPMKLTVRLAARSLSAACYAARFGGGWMTTIACILLAGIALTSSVAASAEPKRDSLIVYGGKFSFAVKEPAGWTGDTEHAARFGANIVFHRSSETIDNAGALIRVRLGSKADEDTAADLKDDMDGYRKQYPKVEFHTIGVSHPKYPVFSKLFVVPGGFYEYVVYLNPGRTVPYLFSVSMNKQKNRATPDEFAAFQRVVASIAFLTTEVKH